MRVLAAVELYINSEFIASICLKIQVFSSIDTVLAISVSHNALDSNKAKGELIQNEAINIFTSFNGAGCPWSCISLFKFSSILLQKYWVNIKVQTNVQSID